MKLTDNTSICYLQHIKFLDQNNEIYSSRKIAQHNSPVNQNDFQQYDISKDQEISMQTSSITHKTSISM